MFGENAHKIHNKTNKMVKNRGVAGGSMERKETREERALSPLRSSTVCVCRDDRSVSPKAISCYSVALTAAKTDNDRESMV